MADIGMSKYRVSANESLSNIHTPDIHDLYRSLKKIADEEIKSYIDQGRFIAFILKWKENEPNYSFSTQYLQEWANRFDKKDEYARADYEKIKYLVGVDGKKDGYDRIEDMYKRYGWSPESIKTEIELFENLTKSEGKTTERKRKLSQPRKAKSTFRTGESQGRGMIRNMNKITGIAVKRFK